MMTVGNKAIYPSQGPCRIGCVVKRVIEGRLIKFYHLIVLDDRGGEMFVPVDKAQAIGVRLLLDRSEIPELLGHLQKTAKIVDDWRQRARNNLKLFTSGSAFDLAEVVESLTELRGARSLTPGESRMLERARRLLVCEISEVMGETKTEAEEQIDKALKARKENEGLEMIA